MELNTILFAPFDGRYCNWFYAMMIFNFILLVISIVSLVAPIKMSPKLRSVAGGAFVQVLIMYINSRLWYSMCRRSYNA